MSNLQQFLDDGLLTMTEIDEAVKAEFYSPLCRIILSTTAPKDMKRENILKMLQYSYEMGVNKTIEINSESETVPKILVIALGKENESLVKKMSEERIAAAKKEVGIEDRLKIMTENRDHCKQKWNYFSCAYERLQQDYTASIAESRRLNECVLTALELAKKKVGE